MRREDFTPEVTWTVPKGSLWTRGLAMAEAEFGRTWSPGGRWSRAAAEPVAGWASRPVPEPAPVRAFLAAAEPETGRASLAGAAGAGSRIPESAEVREAGRKAEGRANGMDARRMWEEPALQGMAA